MCASEFWNYTGVPGGKVNIVGGHSIGHSKQNVCMYVCLIPNSFWDRTMDVMARIKERQDALRRVAKCVDVDSGIFEIVLYKVNCTNFVTWTTNTNIRKVHNISFLSTILELYSEMALYRKPLRVGHIYIYTFLLRMTDTMTSQNIDISSWDNLYKSFQNPFQSH
jgi:hypothetical protein